MFPLRHHLHAGCPPPVEKREELPEDAAGPVPGQPHPQEEKGVSQPSLTGETQLTHKKRKGSASPLSQVRQICFLRDESRFSLTLD